MARLDPYKELGIRPGASPDQARAAYLKRAAETDPARTRGLDPAIQEAAHQARARVEAAYAWVQDPRGEPPEVPGDDAPASGGSAAGSAGTEAGAGPGRLSYLVAVMRTMMLPGMGSVYAGSWRRGLVVFLFFLVGVGVSLSARLAALRAMPAGEIMGKLMVVKEVVIDVYWLFGLAIADALLATWAWNDRVRSGSGR